MNIDITPLIEMALCESKGKSHADAIDELIDWAEQQRYRPLRRGEPEGYIRIDDLLAKLHYIRLDGYRRNLPPGGY